MSNKILIIDDSEEILFAISEFFKLKDWEVFTALNVEEALKFLNSKESEVDIIIIDYNLPYINGVIGVRLIRQINPTVPIIALTIEGEEKIADQFFEVGANDFAIKPIKVLDLYSRVNVHIKNRTHVKEELNLEYRKGINENTIFLIEEKMKDIKEYLTIEEISEITGLAPKTTNKYMGYLVEIKKVDMEIIYGKIGRPKNKYLWKN